MDWNREMSTSQLRKMKYFYRKQLYQIERLLSERIVEKQRNCQHVWKKDYTPSHKSHYDCLLCGMYR